MRGYKWKQYQTDDGRHFLLQVRADYADDPERGWPAVTPAGLVPMPRGWLPRRVLGLDPTGNKQSAICASDAAPLWTGAATLFTVMATDGSQLDCTVYRHLLEVVWAP